MLYNNAIEEAKAEEQPKQIPVKLAEISSLHSDGRAYVKFYGDDSASSKLYSYIEGFQPEVGDVVLMLPQGNTYVIIGTVSNEAIESANPDSPSVVYLTKDAADLLYESINHPSYALASHSHSQLAYGSYLLNFTGTQIGIYNTSNQPSASSTSIGTSGNIFKSAYMTTLYLGSTSGTSSTTESLNMSGLQALKYPGILYAGSSSSGTRLTFASNAVTPSANKTVSLGSSSYYLKDAYFTTLHLGSTSTTTSTTESMTVDDLKKVKYPGILYNGSASNGNKLTFASNVVTPSVSKTISLGSSSYQFNNIYSQTLYLKGTAVTTSDRRMKKDVEDLDKKGIEFFKKLRPVSYKYIDGETEQTHYGFIAQEVENAANESGYATDEFAPVVIQDTGEYGLRYEELIAFQTQVIQDLLRRVEALEANNK